MPVTSFLTRCCRSPEIWRLTGAGYLVISYGAIKGRTASISAADCFAPVVLLYASLPWFKRIFGILTDRELHRTSYLADSPNGSVYRFSREPCPFFISECSLHVGQVGSQNYDRTVSPAGPSRGTPQISVRS
ncbi:hypothetical protein CHARACLAT_031185 [Characodon lateralis]|uniref:Uncharacterized protein n=1 Tax=Characodon lateralis TaxID=208331 RepID=A0ABU7EID3_9TELE|nr:hypothetical protein [Characodon lateralis]